MRASADCIFLGCYRYLGRRSGTAIICWSPQSRVSGADVAAMTAWYNGKMHHGAKSEMPEQSTSPKEIVASPALRAELEDHAYRSSLR